jgi:hypothetical protein
VGIDSITTACRPDPHSAYGVGHVPYERGEPLPDLTRRASLASWLEAWQQEHFEQIKKPRRDSKNYPLPVLAVTA